MALTVGYVGASGVRLVRPVEDIDQVPGYLARFDTASNSYRFPIPAGNNRNLIQRINPNYGSLRSTEWGGHSIYHALQVNLVLNYSYDIPMPAAIRSNRFSNTVLGGWSIGGIYTRQSGGPYSVKIGVDRAFTGNSNAGGSLNSAARHMFVLNSTCTSPAAAVTGVIGKYLNLNCFAFPEAGQLGNLGRNNLTMPTFRNLDFSIFKNQNLMGEKLKAQLRVEMFNVMNNTNIQPQLQTIFDGNGAITSQAGTPTGQFGTFTTNQSRQIQLGLRLIF
ncbi:MAG: hypothetical protein EXQ47_03090 [Bryobacterales bacterium]|nr:hypothetical protein [Bryobacterales bacterium]